MSTFALADAREGNLENKLPGLDNLRRTGEWIRQHSSSVVFEKSCKPTLVLHNVYPYNLDVNKKRRKRSSCYVVDEHGRIHLLSSMVLRDRNQCDWDVRSCGA